MPAHPMTGCQQTPSSACALWLRSVFQWQWAAYAGGGAPSAGHRDALLCLYGPEADWWRAAGSANGRSSNEVQEDWSRQTDVGGIIQTSERNLLGEVPLPSWSHSRSSSYLYPHSRPPATATVMGAQHRGLPPPPGGDCGTSHISAEF